MSDKGDFLAPMLEMPKRVRDALSDPARRRNILGSVAERGAGILAAIGTYEAMRMIPISPWIGVPLALLAAVVAGTRAMLIVYEFVLEPLGVAGHYWERGPRDGEKFENE